MNVGQNKEVTRCHLCGNSPAIQSHIIPKCFNLGDNNNKIVPVNPGSHPKRVPIGIYDRILCSRCDSRWGKLDEYAVKILEHGESHRLAFAKVDGIYTPWISYSYNRLHTFFITLLWRALHSTHEYFSKIQDPILKWQIDQIVFIGDQVAADTHVIMFGYFNNFDYRGSIQPILRKFILEEMEYDGVMFVINNLHITITYNNSPVGKINPLMALNQKGSTPILPVSFMESYVAQAAEDMVTNYPNAFGVRNR